jgi:hypothetical protein
MRIIDEDDEAPMRLLSYFASLSLMLAIGIRFLTRLDGFWVAVCTCACTPAMVGYCYYHAGSGHSRLRRRFTVYLSVIVALVCAIILSHGGLRSRALDIESAVLHGIAGGLISCLAGMVTAVAADPLLRRVRRFARRGGCRACGYDLTGNVSGRCPECGCATRILRREDCV